MRAVRVPVEGRVEEVDFQENNPETWNGLIGSGQAVDFITLREQGLQVIVDDHSILNGEPLNTRMTWFLRGTGRWLSEVYGTVLLVGIHPDSGETVDVNNILSGAMASQGPTVSSPRPRRRQGGTETPG